MKTEQEQLTAMYARVRQVFPAKYLDTLATQQENLLNGLIHDVVTDEGVEAVTVDRLDGMKELITQHLWSDALTTASKSLPRSQTETYETLDSTLNTSPSSATSSNSAPNDEEQQFSMMSKVDHALNRIRSESIDPETLESLLAYCKQDGRICPMPQRWNKLYELLPNRRRTGKGWEPALPLILAAWHDTPALLKAMRLAEHIEWAAQNGALESVSKYVRSLPEEDWFHVGQ